MHICHCVHQEGFVASQFVSVTSEILWKLWKN